MAATLAVIVLAGLGLSLSVPFGRSPPRGSCGGLASGAVWRVAPVPVRPVKHLRDVSPLPLNRYRQQPCVTRREALDPVLSLLGLRGDQPVRKTERQQDNRYAVEILGLQGTQVKHDHLTGDGHQCGSYDKLDVDDVVA